MNNSSGKIIAFMGLPASGKSSISREIASILNVTFFLEPEENEWPDAVKNRSQSGNYTAITWFRSIRVPNLYKADQLRKVGETVIVDSYYDKLLCKYIEKKEMKWLIDPKDKYFQLTKEMSELDYITLPNADCIIFLRISFEDWKYLYQKRNRNLDNDVLFRKSFNTQNYFLNAVNEYSIMSGAKIIIHDQRITSPQKEAEDIITELKKESVIG